MPGPPRRAPPGAAPGRPSRRRGSGVSPRLRSARPRLGKPRRSVLSVPPGATPLTRISVPGHGPARSPGRGRRTWTPGTAPRHARGSSAEVDSVRTTEPRPTPSAPAAPPSPSAAGTSRSWGTSRRRRRRSHRRRGPRCCGSSRRSRRSSRARPARRTRRPRRRPLPRWPHGWSRPRRRPGRGARPRQRRALVRVPLQHGHLRALGEEGVDDGTSDARAGTDDQRSLALSQPDSLAAAFWQVPPRFVPHPR